MIFFFLYHFYFISLLQKSNFIPMTEKDSSKEYTKQSTCNQK